jgi:hypothetical protein
MLAAAAELRSHPQARRRSTISASPLSLQAAAQSTKSRLRQACTAHMPSIAPSVAAKNPHRALLDRAYSNGRKEKVAEKEKERN